VTILYFAWVRQKLGKGEEQMELPIHVGSIGELIEFLRERGEDYSEAFADPARLRAARNQEHVSFAATIRDSDEIAFFPPVTGG
jgi:sulfur-carrier protein